MRGCRLIGEATRAVRGERVDPAGPLGHYTDFSFYPASDGTISEFGAEERQDVALTSMDHCALV